MKRQELNKQEQELLTGLAISYGVGIIPQAKRIIIEQRETLKESKK